MTARRNDRRTVADASYGTGRRYIRNGGIGRDKLDIARRQHHALLVLKVTGERKHLRLSAHQLRQPLEVNLHQLRIADIHRHGGGCRLRVAVVRNEAESGRSGVACFGLEDHVLAVAAHRGGAVRRARYAIERRVAFEVRNQRLDRHARIEINMSVRRGCLHRRRLVRAVPVGLREQLTIDIVDRAVAIEVGVHVEGCISRHRAEGRVEG